MVDCGGEGNSSGRLAGGAGVTDRAVVWSEDTGCAGDESSGQCFPERFSKLFPEWFSEFSRQLSCAEDANTLSVVGGRLF
jgi:hypothetical protein